MASVDGMIVHHTGGGGTVNSVISTLKQRGLSVQFVVDRDGKTYQLIPDGMEAHHIMSGWGPAGEGKSNHNMQGVEVIARNDRDVTAAQKTAVQALVSRQAGKYGYDPRTSVFGHGEVNPGHKEADEGMSSVNLIRGGATVAGQ
jgi:N-acetyl-anhydromuramyl-L-alanine amidase AmpD